MIKYLGSKRLLTSAITATMQDLSQGDRVLDLFSGTSRVGQALKKQGFMVSANDHNLYAHTIALNSGEANGELTLCATRSLRRHPHYPTIHPGVVPLGLWKRSYWGQTSTNRPSGRKD